MPAHITGGEAPASEKGAAMNRPFLGHAAFRVEIGGMLAF
jgi:hypothetical protein